MTGLQIKALKVARTGKQVLYNVDLTIAGQDHGPARCERRREKQPGAGDRRRPTGIGRSNPARRRLARGSATGDGARGVAAVPEGHQVLADMTVEDNLKVVDSHLKQADANVAIEVALNGFPELRERLQARSGILSGRQQQMVALMQAIIAKPRYLLAGELSSELAPVVVARLVPVSA